MNKKFVAILLAMFIAVSLTACGKKDNDNKVVEPENKVEQTENEKESTEPENKQTESKEAETTDAQKTEEEILIERLHASDYVAKVKKITKGPKGEEVKVLDSLKGVLAHDKVQDLELEADRAYLVFMKDDNGTPVFTDDNSLILLEGDQHELFETLNKELHK